MHSFQMANIASIIESVKTADGLISEVFAKSCALEWAPKFGGKCRGKPTDGVVDENGLFGDEWCAPLAHTHSMRAESRSGICRWGFWWLRSSPCRLGTTTWMRPSWCRRAPSFSWGSL